jgi:hypothetical protein
MNRRTLLRLLGGAAVPASLGLTADELLAAGRALHGRHRSPDGLLPPFTAHQRATVAALAEAILPATDTPGATAARVDEYIALLLNEWYPPESRTAFLSGLDAFDARSTRELGHPFLALGPAARLRLLTALDSESREPQPPGAARPFFQWMKDLTVSGFYSSKVGSEQFLHTVIWPGRYDGCRTIGARPQGSRP